MFTLCTPSSKSSLNLSTNMLKNTYSLALHTVTKPSLHDQQKITPFHNLSIRYKNILFPIHCYITHCITISHHQTFENHTAMYNLHTTLKSTIRAEVSPQWKLCTRTTKYVTITRISKKISLGKIRYTLVFIPDNRLFLIFQNYKNLYTFWASEFWNIIFWTLWLIFSPNYFCFSNFQNVLNIFTPPRRYQCCLYYYNLTKLVGHSHTP